MDFHGFIYRCKLKDAEIHRMYRMYKNINYYYDN